MIEIRREIKKPIETIDSNSCEVQIKKIFESKAQSLDKQKLPELSFPLALKDKDSNLKPEHHDKTRLRQNVSAAPSVNFNRSNYPENVSLRYHEKSSGKFFKDKKIVFDRPKSPYKKDLNEHGINNMGVILDLDDVVALTKIGAPGAEAHVTPSKINPVPSGAFGWLASVFGGYLTIAGMYFGFDNIKGGHRREKKLKPLLDKCKEYVKSLKKDKNVKPQEIKNMEAYTRGIDYSIKDSRFQKWISGITAFSGAANLFSSLIYSVLTIPGLSFMTIFGLGNTLKNSFDLKRTKKIDINKLSDIKSKLGDKGKKIFTDRLKTKKAFFKKVIPAWGSFTVGSSIVLGSSIAGLLGVTFPFGLMAGAAALIVAGVVGIIYHTYKHHKMLTPKNENRINRQYLGNDEDILWKIAVNKTNLDLVDEFEKNIYNNFVKEKPGKRVELFFKRTGSFIAKILTLGIPKFVNDIDGKIQNKYYKYQEDLDLRQKTREERYKYFEKYIRERIEYLSFLKENINLIDESVLKLYKGNISGNQIGIKEGEDEVIRKINASLNEQKQMLQKLTDGRKRGKPEIDFNVTWDFIHNSKIETKLFEVLFESLLKKKEIERYEKAGYINKQWDSVTHENILKFDKVKFENDLKELHPEALSLLNYFYRKFDKIIIEDVKHSLEYTYDELSDHLEERLRKV